ncbi:MAG: hypothetical protein NT140_01330 [Deltaproteobacteria bacterium]|nr:hypothetical protein [Deltaproteobacteria bacterium]
MLFENDDLIFIGERHEPGIMGVNIRPAKEWRELSMSGAKLGPQFCINPLNGMPSPKKSGDGTTLRGDANVKTYRYCLIEFDGLDRESQIKFYSAVKLPIRALIDSGNKSIHALVDVQVLAKVETLEQWTTEIKQNLYERLLIPLGVDGQCSNPSRLSRLPGHYRTEKQAWQRLLWLSKDGQYAIE